MATRKNHYYILVLSDFGSVFVTNNDREFSYWERTDVPMDYGSKKYAESEAYGLRLNGHKAYAITLPYELDYQPYLYDRGHWEWVRDEKN